MFRQDDSSPFQNKISFQMHQANSKALVWRLITITSWWRHEVSETAYSGMVFVWIYTKTKKLVVCCFDNEKNITVPYINFSVDSNTI